jgi:hypothetical protein
VPLRWARSLPSREGSARGPQRPRRSIDRSQLDGQSGMSATCRGDRLGRRVVRRASRAKDASWRMRQMRVFGSMVVKPSRAAAASSRTSAETNWSPPGAPMSSLSLASRADASWMASEARRAWRSSKSSARRITSSVRAMTWYSKRAWRSMSRRASRVARSPSSPSRARRMIPERTSTGAIWATTTTCSASGAVIARIHSVPSSSR